MGNELRSSAHTVGEENLHLQFTPAYRRDVFVESMARELTVAYLVQRAHEMKVEVAAIDCGPDHVHLFVKHWKNWSIPVLAGQLKTYSSRMMRKGHKFLFGHKLYGKKFWSSGYFYRTVGVVTAETVKRYVAEGQKKHWEEREFKQQKTLFSYS
ncbi:IS200/IS605 family transposase [Candidatus Woesearchaeota archaeon]|nr:IS200/IS605 family transposase [Candidatus Woesearchaeota archaeon]